MWASRSPDAAPLPAHTGEWLTFSDIVEDAHAEAVLVVFFPFAFSPICHEEVTSLSLNRAVVEDSRIAPVAVSCDSKFSLTAWAAQNGIEIPLLSDFWPHGAFARACEAFDEDKGMARRTSVLFDSQARTLARIDSTAGTGRDHSAQGLERWVRECQRAIG